MIYNIQRVLTHLYYLKRAGVNARDADFFITTNEMSRDKLKLLFIYTLSPETKEIK